MKKAIVKIESCEDLYKFIRLFSTAKPNWVYRGQANSDWGLTTTYERICREAEKRELSEKMNSGNVENPVAEYMRTIGEMDELKMIAKFLEVSTICQLKPNNKVSCLGAMQHYGIPTRMLDFTEALLVALYFAFNDTGNVDRAVWAVNTEVLINEIREHYHNEFIGTDSEMCMKYAEEVLESGNEIRPGVVPIRLFRDNDRIMAQAGLFLVPVRKESFEANMNIKEIMGSGASYTIDNMVKSDICKQATFIKVVISASLREAVMCLLRAANLYPYIIYPDFEGVRQFVGREVKFNRI